MLHDINIVKADKLFSRFLVNSTLAAPMEDAESYCYWPGEIGEGFISMIKLGPGLVLGIGNYQLMENIAVDFEFELPHHIFISYTATGCIDCTMNNGTVSETTWKFKPGSCIAAYHPKWRGIARYPVGAPVHTIGIYLDFSLLSGIIQGYEDQFLPKISHLLSKGDKAEPFCEELVITPSVNLLIQQILNCPYRFPLKRLFLESKVMELIMYGMEPFLLHKNALPDNMRLKQDDVERIREAGNILLTHLDDPPSLLRLARLVGVNKNKLNQGFRMIYGTSVFDYLRIIRLEKARELLSDKNKNVTQVAMDVGYAHQRNFTRAFKNYFGTSPKDYLRD